MKYRRDMTPPRVVAEGAEAVVKWFNTTKGFGFVSMEDGSGDAFLHASVLTQLGYDDLPPGTRLICDVAEGRKGLQVAQIDRIEEMGDPSAAPPPPRGGPRSGGDDYGQSEDLDATMKFFNAEKGFGFAVPDDGSKDVYVSMRVVERAGVDTLEPNQRVRLSVRMGERGPVARDLQII